MDLGFAGLGLNCVKLGFKALRSRVSVVLQHAMVTWRFMGLRKYSTNVAQPITLYDDGDDDEPPSNAGF